jgi:hypothetical protein
MQRRQKNQQFIDEYKAQRGCQCCGATDDPIMLELHKHNVAEKDVQASKLPFLGRKRLLQELEKSDVLCVTCHRLAHSETD